MLIIIATLLSVFGAVCVALGRADHANITWSIANPLLVYHNFMIGENWQFVMFLVFTALAFFGVFRKRWHHAN